jgi:hypothetical protein
LLAASGPAELLSVLPHDRCGRLKANADGAALVDKGAFGGNPPDNIFGGQYRRHPATTLKTQPGTGQSPG